MRRKLRLLVAGGLLMAPALMPLAVTGPALAQKSGGILQMPNFTSPASMSIHEESTIAVGIPMMGVFNNLVVFDQHAAQKSLASVVPDLATGWAWNERGAHTTCPPRQGAASH